MIIRLCKESNLIRKLKGIERILIRSKARSTVLWRVRKRDARSRKSKKYEKMTFYSIDDRRKVFIQGHKLTKITNIILYL